MSSDCAAESGTERSRATVLYVEDDDAFADLTAQRLEAEGRITVRTVGDAETALKHLGEVDCVLSDYDLPGMDGLELLEHIRTTEESLPFILFTAKGTEEVASDAISLGATDYVRKGSRPDQYEWLSHRIERAVEAYRAATAAEETRERARRVLRRRQARFRALIEHSPTMISVLGREGTFQYVTPSVERILGYKPRELVGEDAFSFIHEADRASVQEKFVRAVENPEYRPTATYRFRAADGEWRWLESRGTNRLTDPDVEGFVVNSRDVTRRHEAEQTLRAERDLTERILAVTPNPLVVLDTDGRVDIANERAKTVLGMAEDEVLGLSADAPDVTVTDLDGEPVPESELLSNRVERTGEPVRDVRHRVELPTGEEFVFALDAAPVFDQAGNLTNVVISFRDVDDV